jgi:hypothetical protein
MSESDEDFHVHLDEDGVHVLRMRLLCMRLASGSGASSDLHDIFTAFWGPCPHGDLQLETRERMNAIIRMVLRGASALEVFDAMTDVKE